MNVNAISVSEASVTTETFDARITVYKISGDNEGFICIFIG